MPRKPKGQQLENEAESKRFIETAREVGADGEQSRTALDDVFGKLVPPKKPKPPPSDQR